MIFIAIFLPALLGFLSATLLLRNDSSPGLLERLSISYPLGAGIVAMQVFLMGIFRIPLVKGNMLIPVLGECALLAFVAVRSGTAVFRKQSSGPRREMIASRTTWMRKSIFILLILWVAAKLGSIFFETYLRPLCADDSWANWSAGAKIFYYSKSLLLDAPGADFFGGGVVGRFTAYPLLNTLTQVWISLCIGGFDDVLVKYWTPCYLLSMVLYLYVLISRELGRVETLAVLVLFLSSPLLSLHATEVYSDLPLSTYLLFVSGAFLNGMKYRHAQWKLVGLFSAMALFTKEEALFFILPVLISASIYVWRNALPAQRSAQILSLVAPLVYVAPWYTFKFSHFSGLGANSVHLRFTFHPEIILRVISDTLSLRSFNIFFVFLPVFALTSGRWSKQFFHLLFPTALFALFFLALYVCTTDYYAFFNVGTVFDRNLLTYYPIVTVLTVLLLKTSPNGPTYPVPARNS